jgi:hypothetical protein
MNDGNTVWPVYFVLTVTVNELGSVIVGSEKGVTEFTSAFKLKGEELHVRLGRPPIFKIKEYAT